MDPAGRSTEEYPANYAANEIVNGMMLRNAFVIGGAAGQPMQAGSNAPVYLALYNQRGQTDELISVSAAPVFSGASIPGGELPVQPGQLAGGGLQPQAVLTGLTRQLRSGSYIPVVFTFRDAGTLKKQVPVLPPSQWRTPFSPAPQSP
ncbi:hypothetical protein [Nonomuraea ceibae]|uniref:hypothetical protein n=1 Tax=Nonomuraea ceibae TaxID=1935170 RepID=UPI001C5F803B|nr:hypothetical protein [Nonomuraea ceibae]